VSGVISFSEKSSDAAWVVAGWAFRQVLVDVMTVHRDDDEMLAMFDQAEAVGYLFLDSTETALTMRAVAAIKEVATGILAGKIRSGIGELVERVDEPGLTEEYFKGLRDLLGAVEAGENHAASSSAS